MLPDIADLDREDELTPYRDLFVDNGTVYLNGNSLGKMPVHAIELMREVVEREWAHGLISSWYSKWLKRPQDIASKLAAFLGVSPDEIFIGDSTSINLYKLIFGALSYQKKRAEVLMDDLNFPTDYYVLKGILEESFVGHVQKTIASKDGVCGDEDGLVEAITENTALVFLSQVTYKSAFMYDMHRINQKAKEKGALVLWDLSHSVGSVPLDLQGSNTDLAVGCLYKYMNGGPGSPAFLYVRKDLQEKIINPIKAWFGHKNGFAFSPEFEPHAGIQKFAVGTPGMLSLSATEPGIDLMNQVGIHRLREKSIKLSEYFIGQFYDRLESLGYGLESPKETNKRGSHLTLSHEFSDKIYKALSHPQDSSKKPVVCDFRPPNLLRFGIAPIYISFHDIALCIGRLEEIILDQEYKNII